MPCTPLMQQFAWGGTAFGAVAAGISAIVATAGYRQARSLAQEERGYNTYADYLQLAFENPNFSTVSTEAALAELRDNATEFEKYEWYVSRMLWAFEQIFKTVGGDGSWRKSINAQLTLHAPYLCGEFCDQNYADDYANPLRTMLKSIEKTSNRRGAAS